MLKDIRGISLIEIIITISIVAILLTVPVINSIPILRYKEKKELKEFINDIIYARDMSIIESKRYYFDIAPEKNMYAIYTDEGITKNIVKCKELTEGIVIKYTNIKSNEIGFTYSGAPDNSGTIYLENRKGKSIRITILPVTGRVNMYFDWYRSNDSLWTKGDFC